MAYTIEDVRKNAQILGRIPADEVKRLKGQGFLQDKNTGDHFNARIPIPGGILDQQLAGALTQAAARYGNGSFAMTTRLSVEIQGIAYENIEPLKEFLAAYGLYNGGTGPKVRPVVACKGATCHYGLINSYQICRQMHERFYVGYHDVKLPHKFKIAVGGCPNNCVKPDLNDVGVIGQRVPHYDPSLCRNCKVCSVAKECPIHAAVKEGDVISYDAERCSHCGRCVGKCPFHVNDSFTDGFRIYVGGRWGKEAARGQFLPGFYTSLDEVLDTVEKCILFFKESGKAGERFAQTIDRLGMQTLEKAISGPDPLDRKSQIIENN